MPRQVKSSSSVKCINGPTNTFTLASPIGEMELVACPKGVHSLQLTAKTDKDFSPDPGREVKILQQLYKDNGYTYKSAITCVDWLNIYFRRPSGVLALTQPDVCHLLNLNEKARFTSLVWKALAEKVAMGESVSYGRLAELSGGTPNHSRAVGQAMRNNPVMIIVPCHRVLPSTGSVGNYSGGRKNGVKAWLLHHEGNTV